MKLTNRHQKTLAPEKDQGFLWSAASRKLQLRISYICVSNSIHTPMNSYSARIITLSILFMSILSNAAAQQPVTISLWPGSVPGESKPKAGDVISDDRSRNVTRISSVTNPAIEVMEPAGGNTTGLGVVVCPGGGYGILAIDLEGYEVAAWLNNLGITAFVLHYRVPDNPAGALKDAQRAIRKVRDLYADGPSGLKKVGIMGFSAGGSLSARASTRFTDQTYEPVDAADKLSARPDFTLLIYPAYLDQGPDRSLTPELTVNPMTPPAFIFETADDPYGNSALVMAGALRDQKVPVELHFLPHGGHGYGVREGNPAAETWPGLAAAWLQKISNSTVE
jgi:acetyl esterase/lipase